MDQNVPKLYKEYGQYVNESRAFPLSIDGLKPVERKVLLSSYLIAKNKLVKSVKIDGYTIGNFSPHGNCLDGSTEILLLDGSKRKIKDLVGVDNFWVYSCKQDGTIVPGKAHSVRVTNIVKELYCIELDNKKTLMCTGDHLIMMRDGTYKKAKELNKHDSLMPLYRIVEDGYNLYKRNDKKYGRSEKVCWMVIRNLIDDDLDILIKKHKCHTHHKNSIRNDDRPENIEILHSSEHASMLSLPKETYKLIGRKKREKYYNDIEFREKMLKGLEKGREKMFTEEGPIRDKIKKKNSKLINQYNKIQTKDRILKIIKILLNEEKEINEENYEDIRKTRHKSYPLWLRIFERFDSLDDAIIEASNNHKISYIKKVIFEKPIKVYDMAVDNYHNFAVDQGIFVHNCYGTIVQLVRQGFLTGQGNFGSNIGADSNPPAASRYTEVKLEPKMIQLAFNYISYVEWKINDLGEKEPIYLPTMFPITLMGTDYTQGIGFGYRTFIPCYKITDLQKRLLWLLGESKVEPIIKPISDCKIISNDEVLKELLTTGKAKIDVEGIIKISKRNSSVTLKSWPPGKRFVSLLTKFSKEFDNQDIGFTDLSSTETNIVFQVLRQRNKDLIFNTFVKKLKRSIKGAISFETIVVEPDKEIKLKSIDDMLLDTFDMYLNVNKTMLEYEISKIQTIIDEIKILIKIKPYLSKVLLLKDDIKKAISIISEKSKVDEKIISKLFSKYNISKLLTVNTDTTKLLNEISVYKNNLSNLKTFVINQYKGE